MQKKTQKQNLILKKMGINVFWKRLFSIVFPTVGCKYDDLGSPLQSYMLLIPLKALINALFLHII